MIDTLITGGFGVPKRLSSVPNKQTGVIYNTGKTKTIQTKQVQNSVVLVSCDGKTTVFFRPMADLYVSYV